MNVKCSGTVLETQAALNKHAQLLLALSSYSSVSGHGVFTVMNRPDLGREAQVKLLRLGRSHNEDCLQEHLVCEGSEQLVRIWAEKSHA